ncbi:hypothetical protein CHK_0012 [Christensenella hongkongensis]|uniref:Uncharacterized protein n=1 Tax=Christensenella hongkongensis TaxID=270498 RepID=A0A0M2NJX8_9FIRM|nr:hypothetical protein CHK_0012 [Christensenella hongkongensis]
MRSKKKNQPTVEKIYRAVDCFFMAFSRILCVSVAEKEREKTEELWIRSEQ